MNKFFTIITLILVLTYFVVAIVNYRNPNGIDDLAYCISMGIDKRN